MPAQELAWCRTVLRHAVIRAASRYRRWSSMEMSLDALMESEGVRGDELSDPTSMDGFTQVEMDLLIDLLSPKHRVIIHMLYVERFSQRQVACVFRRNRPRKPESLNHQNRKQATTGTGNY